MTSPSVQTIARRSLLARLNPFGPLMGKELRSMARRRRSYYLRSVYLMVLLAVLAMGWASMSGGVNSGNVAYRAQQQAEMGREFFQIFAFFSVICMMLIAPVLTCTAIGGERLHKTFHVLLMTPISAGQIVSGKIFSRMLAVLGLVGLSLPALAVVRLLGGVELDDMFGLIALVAATGLFAASLGLFFSCFMTRAWAVILLSFITQAFLYLGFPMIVMLLVAIAGQNGSQRAVWQPLQFVLVWPNPLVATMVNILPGAPVGKSWLFPALTMLGMSSVLLLWSAAVVRRLARREGSGERGSTSPPAANSPPTPAQAVADFTQNMAEPVGNVSEPTVLAYRTANPQRADALLKARKPVSDRPILWYEMHQPLIRRAGFRIMAILLAVGLLLFSYLGLNAIGFSRSPLSYSDTQIGYAFVFGGLLTLIVAVLSATVIANEKESDTWTLLLASPISGKQIILGKLAGVWRRTLGLMILIVAHFLLFTVTGVISWWVLPMLLLVMVGMNFLFTATGIFLSLRCRKTTTAVVLNLLIVIFVWVAVPIVVGVLYEVLRNTFEYEWAQSVYGNFAENWLYPLHPVYYFGEAIDRSNRDVLSRVPAFVLDPFGLKMPGWVFPMAAIQTTIVYVGLAALILWGVIRRFDRIVGRAGTHR